MSRVPAKAKQAEPEITQPDDLRVAIERVVGNVVTARQSKEIAERVSALVVSETFTGPMPHPRHMREYAEMIPDGANRLMKMAEQSLAHSIDQERKVIGAEIRDRVLGMVLGFIGLLALVGAAVGSVYLDAHASVPIAFVSASALGAIGMFIKGRHK